MTHTAPHKDEKERDKEYKGAVKEKESRKQNRKVRATRMVNVYDCGIVSW